MLTWLLTAAALAGSTVLAVLPLEANTADERLKPLGYGLSDMLVTDLHGLPDLRLVERSRLDRVMAELSLQQTGFTDPRTVAELGRGVGATHVLVGSLNDGLEGIRLDVRLIEVSTADVTTTAMAAGPAETVLQLEADVANQLVQSLGGAPTVTPESIGFDELLSASARLASSETKRLQQLRAVKRYQTQAWRRTGASVGLDGSDIGWVVVTGGGDAVTAPTIAERFDDAETLAEMQEYVAFADARHEVGKRIGLASAATFVGLIVGNAVLSRGERDGLPSGLFVTGIAVSAVVGPTVPMATATLKQQAHADVLSPRGWYELPEVDPLIEQHNAALAQELGLTEEQRIRVDLQD